MLIEIFKKAQDSQGHIPTEWSCSINPAVFHLILEFHRLTDKCNHFIKLLVSFRFSEVQMTVGVCRKAERGRKGMMETCTQD